MESPNAPIAQDFFTPAWLKLPDPQLTRKSSSSSASAVSPSSQSTVDPQPKRQPNNSYNSFHRKELNNSTNSLSANDSRDRFVTNNLHNDSSQTYLRHNSFGSEPQFNNSSQSSPGNHVNGFRPKKYSDSSSSSANQRPGYRSNTYKTPTNAYHSSAKPNRDDDPFNPNFDSPTKRFSNKSSDYGLDNEVKRSSNEKNSNNVWNKEFPSLLVNDTNGGQKSGPNDNSSFHSAWSNNATKSKVLSTSKNFQLIHSSVANFDNIQSGNKSEANITSNASKPAISSGVYRNSLSLIGKAGKTGILKENAIYSRIQPMITKSATQSTTPAMEILVKNPKKRSNKSDFLNSIRGDKESDSKDNNRFEEKFEKMSITSDNRNNYDESESQRGSDKSHQLMNENDLKNSQNINNKYVCLKPDDYDDEDMGVLSSSLEAEHRLLLELGWKAGQDDDPSYAPLTEDEVNEFKDLINNRNGVNGIKQRTTITGQPNQPTIQLQMSPKKWPQNGRHNEEPDDESTSSSDDD